MRLSERISIKKKSTTTLTIECDVSELYRSPSHFRQSSRKREMDLVCCSPMLASCTLVLLHVSIPATIRHVQHSNLRSWKNLFYNHRPSNTLNSTVFPYSLLFYRRTGLGIQHCCNISRISVKLQVAKDSLSYTY
jgi:hypothetical protein